MKIDNDSNADSDRSDFMVTQCLESHAQSVESNYRQYTEMPRYAAVAKDHGKDWLQESIQLFWNAIHNFETLPQLATVMKGSQVRDCWNRVNRIQAKLPRNWPSTTGKPSGSGRDNNLPALA